MTVSEDEIYHSLPKAKPGANAPMLISVFLVLLTIFMVLNSMSHVNNQKLQSLVSSVNDAFGLPVKVKDAEDADTALTTVAANFFAEVKNWAQELSELQGMEVMQKGNSMMLRLPTPAVFEQDMNAYVYGVEPKIRELGRLLSTWMQNNKLSVEVVMEVPPANFGDDPVRAEQLAINRADYLAATLNKANVPSANLMPAIRKTTGDYVVLRFAFSASRIPAAKLKAVFTPAKKTGEQ